MNKPDLLRLIREFISPGHPRHNLGYFEDVETRQCRRFAHYIRVCVAVIFVCLIQNYFVVPDVFRPVTLCALGLAVPLLLIGGALVRRRRRGAAEFAVLASFTSLPLWAFWLIGSSRSDEHMLALYGLTLCCLMYIWYNATFGVRLWKPILCYVVVSGAVIGMFLRLPTLSWQINLSLALIVLTAAVMAILSNLFMQRDERGFVSEGERLLTAIAAGRHDLWALDIPTGRLEMLRATSSGPRPSSRLTYDQYLAWIQPDDRQYVLQHARNCIDRGESQEPCQYRVRHDARGEWRWCEAMGKVVERDLSSKPLTVLGMTKNISDREQLTRQLQQQTEQTALATRAKSEFLATMSHEIRTPLNGILGMAALLVDADLTVTQREMVSIIRGSGATLLQILIDVLDFSKMEAGKLSLAQAPFAVRDAAAHCMKGIEISARQKSLTTALSVAADVPRWLLGDAVHLSTILSHLLSNAVKFTDAGRVDLEVVTAGRNTEGVETLRFEVRDTGIGIGRESQKRLFSPFTQAHENAFKADSGVGLGLALSKKLVEALGGSIACWSEAGVGSCFTVTLPFAICANAPSLLPANDKLTPTEDVRILVAEDNPVNQLVLLKMLKRMGYVPTVVANGLEALEAVQKADYDIVFMDCEMPVLDGLEATRRIRQLPAGRQLPIVALSAHSPGEHKTLCTAAGMTDYLTKPISFEDLQELLRRLIERPGP